MEKTNLILKSEWKTFQFGGVYYVQFSSKIVGSKIGRKWRHHKILGGGGFKISFKFIKYIFDVVFQSIFYYQTLGLKNIKTTNFQLFTAKDLNDMNDIMMLMFMNS